VIPIEDSVPRHCPPLITWTIIGINVAVFLYETTLPPQALEQFMMLFGVVPARYTSGEFGYHFLGGKIVGYWPFLTSLFLHGGWAHIFGNMWTLWIFGDNVEDQMGPLRFTIFYLCAGIVASIFHIMANPTSTLPTIGASGAISGVLGAYYVLFPRARIILMVPIFFFPFFFELPAFFYLAFWFLEQVLSGTFALAAPRWAGGVAWWAHIGGFLFGVFTCRLFLLGAKTRHWCGNTYAELSDTWGFFNNRERI